ncbi:hypothetical protein M9Y10_024944 [Tritrichomonas musculus]|uniref:Uncharacterized protein n=1 Tax=Tritrichomonas musculus TaxID=1915356 RepID=A0ABR2HBN2_9EUKA
MTFNNEVLHNTSAEVNTQISSYFDIVDNAVAMSDTNKKYIIDAQASYSIFVAHPQTYLLTFTPSRLVLTPKLNVFSFISYISYGNEIMISYRSSKSFNGINSFSSRSFKDNVVIYYIVI